MFKLKTTRFGVQFAPQEAAHWPQKWVSEFTQDSYQLLPKNKFVP
jgi:hypothetical protein